MTAYRDSLFDAGRGHLYSEAHDPECRGEEIEVSGPSCQTCGDTGVIETASREWGPDHTQCPDCEPAQIGDEPE